MLSRPFALASVVAALTALTACGGGAPPSRSAKDRPPPASKDAVNVGIRLRSQTFTLPNGLVVVLHPESTARTVYVHVEYEVGSKDDPPGRAGLAHLFEHLMFEPTKHGGDKEVGTWLDEIGASHNASTNVDVTRYHESIPPRELPRALWIEADRMAYPVAKVTDDALAREREVVKNEWREHYENEPYGHVWSVVQREIFGAQHPYGLPTIGLPKDLDAVTLDDLRSFARAHYRPNHATLVVCGAFNPAVARPIVERYFATIPPGPPPKTWALPAPELSGPRTVEVAADVPAPAVVLAWPAPVVHGDGWEELWLGLSLFRGSANHTLVTEKKIATEFSANIVQHRLGSIAAVEMKLAKGASVDDAISLVDEYIATATRYGNQYSYDRFPDLKTKRMVSEIAGLERLENRAAELVHGLRFHDGEPDAVQNDLRRWQSVRLVDAAGAVRQLLVDKPRLTVVVQPTKSAPRAGKVIR